ncbi:MAG: UDP-N-acetylmuramoyl-L-alanine--D-glutamate ligase [Rikenellaceae bacterium]
MSRIVVLGGGESGYGSAYLAKKEGFEVFLSDKGELKEEYREALRNADIRFEEGHHTMEKILNADIIIKSPGLPESAPVMVAIREQGIKVVSEIEFAGKYCKAKTICVTGSNGKTTTVSLIYDMLVGAGYNVALGGNIGKSFALSVATQDYDWYVLELSSFQLDDMFDFKADISLLTNITPDHLDRYDHDMSKYVKSKFRILQNQTSKESFIYNLDDPYTMDYLSKNKINGLQMFGITSASKKGNFFDKESGFLSFNIDGKNVELNLSMRLCSGVHNAYNFSQAAAAALMAGVSCEDVQKSINTFQGIEHRVEAAGEREGVRYINDSKATNVDAAWYALEATKEPTVWIAGGTDKGNDYSQLYGVISNVHTLVCMGVDNSKLIAAFEGKIPKIISTATFVDAMEAAIGAAQRGDVVLLSPACASFDLFKNYEDRGRLFKEYIKNKK